MTTKQTTRAAILHHHLAGKKNSEIFKVLRKSGVKRTTIFDVVKRYLEKTPYRCQEVTSTGESTTCPNKKKSSKIPKEISKADEGIKVNHTTCP
jgi:hypothetical protein